jgi:hypothetical protein
MLVGGRRCECRCVGSLGEFVTSEIIQVDPMRFQ